MHEEFRRYTDGLDKQLLELLQMKPVTLEQPIVNSPKGGVYLFTEKGDHLYVGRTKRKFSARLKGHVNTAKDCPFAFRMAREETGYTKSSYNGEGTRKKLLENETFIMHTRLQRNESRKWKFVGFRSLILRGRLCLKSTFQLF